MPEKVDPQPRIIGRYALYDEIAAGGMATVHVGRLLGPVGFSRTVAIKRLHPQFAKDPEFVSMFLDEARLAARIRHPNVVPTLDVVALEGELFLVMEYIQGESLSRLNKAASRANLDVPPKIISTIMAGVLHGLHAAHEAKTEHGEHLSIVHRDVSPQNVLVGIDGVPRVLDFGVAKAAHRAQTTREGQVKGKLGYMAPEQLRSDVVDRRSDVYAASVVLWEAMTRRRLFSADSEARLLTMILLDPIPSPREALPSITPEVEKIIMRGLERDPAKRYATAREMAIDLETTLPVASASEIGAWVDSLAGESLSKRAHRVADIESKSDVHRALISVPPPPSSSSSSESAPPNIAPESLRTPPPVSQQQPQPSRSSLAESEQTLIAPVALDANKGKRKVWAGIVLGVLALVTTGVLSAHFAGGSAPAAASVEVLKTALPQPAATSPAPSEPASSEAAASASAVAPPTNEPAVANRPSTKTTPSPISRRPSQGRPAPAAAPAPPAAAPAAPNCNPPFTVDAAGIRHLKPECI